MQSNIRARIRIRIIKTRLKEASKHNITVKRLDKITKH